LISYEVYNLEVKSTDSLYTYLSYDKSLLVGSIAAGESKEIKIPLFCSTSFDDAKVGFNIIAREANNYDSKPAIIDVHIKAANATMAVNWYYPYTTESKSNNETYTIKACIITQFPVTEISLYHNSNPLSSDRSFRLKKTEGCDNYLEQDIKLQKGENLVRIVAKNKKTLVDSEVRKIIYSDVEYENRTALVIGNSKYDVAPLKNPANDAKSMAKALRDLKFDVIEIIDGDISTIRKAIRDFHNRLDQSKGVGLFYYAGHGVQIKGENYIMPVKHDIKEEFEVEDKSIRVNSVLDAMENTGTHMNIVILDACRDNPFARSMRSAQRGLAQIYAEGSGSLIAYATAPGSVAADGNGENGLYTQELLKAIKTPGLEIGMVFRTVLTNVKKLSSGQQLPWTNSSIEGEFYFVK
jgi:hypothetical protein